MGLVGTFLIILTKKGKISTGKNKIAIYFKHFEKEENRYPFLSILYHIRILKYKDK